MECKIAQESTDRDPKDVSNHPVILAISYLHIGPEHAYRVLETDKLRRRSQHIEANETRLSQVSAWEPF